MQKKIKKNGGGGTLNDTMGGRDLHGGKRFLEGGSSNFEDTMGMLKVVQNNKLSISLERV